MDKGTEIDEEADVVELVDQGQPWVRDYKSAVRIEHARGNRVLLRASF